MIVATEEFLEKLYERLVSDSLFSSLLSVYQGQPAVFHRVAPDDVEKPYLVYFITSSRRRDTHDKQAEEYRIQFSIVTASDREALRALERLEILLNRLPLDLIEGKNVYIFKENFLSFDYVSEVGGYIASEEYRILIEEVI